MVSLIMFVIVGGGFVGVKVVEVLCCSDFGGWIILFGDEEYLFYDWLLFFKEFLVGKKLLSDFII